MYVNRKHLKMFLTAEVNTVNRRQNFTYSKLCNWFLRPVSLNIRGKGDEIRQIYLFSIGVQHWYNATFSWPIQKEIQSRSKWELLFRAWELYGRLRLDPFNWGNFRTHLLILMYLPYPSNGSLESMQSFLRKASQDYKD